MAQAGWEHLLVLLLFFCSTNTVEGFRHPYIAVRHHDTSTNRRGVGVLGLAPHQSSSSLQSSSSSTGDKTPTTTTFLDPAHNVEIPVVVVPPLRFEIRLDDGNDDVGHNSSSSTTTTTTTMDYDDDRILAFDLTCVEDIERTIEKYSHRLQSSQEREGLIKLLTDYWTQHVQYCNEEQVRPTGTASNNLPIVYVGPTPSTSIPSIEEYEKSVVAKIDIPTNNGLVLTLEVADSTIPNAGKGLFVRKSVAEEENAGGGILQTIGSAFCGYGRGRFVPSLDTSTTTTGSAAPLSHGMKERTFEFRLEQGIMSTVWYDGQLMSIGEAVEKSNATHVACHSLTFKDDDNSNDKNNEDRFNRHLMDIHPVDIDENNDHDQYSKYRYFVPLEEQPDFSALSIHTVGQMANDLAGGRWTRVDSSSSIGNDSGSTTMVEQLTTEEEYHELSAARNILVLIPRIELEITEIDPSEKSSSHSDGMVDQECNRLRRVLRPSGMPVMTLSRSVIITNTNIPMEVGCQYGYYYWSS